MIKIGITGSMGSGKTFVVKQFSKLGIPTLLMDDLAKEIQTTNKELISLLMNRFPEGYPNGILNIPKMREILFQDESGKNKEDIAKIIFPFIFKEVEKFYQEHKDSDYVIVESALLYEQKMENIFDCIIFVHSDPNLRKEKALKRDNISSKDYDNRMKTQIPDSIKIKKSDFIINNDFTDNVIDEVKKLDNTLKKWIKVK